MAYRYQPRTSLPEVKWREPETLYERALAEIHAGGGMSYRTFLEVRAAYHDDQHAAVILKEMGGDHGTADH